MKLCTVVEAAKTKDDGRQNPMMFSLILPQFSPHNAFSMGRSEHSSIEAREEIEAVNS